MDSELLHIVFALAAVVLPLAFAGFIVNRQSGSKKRQKKDI